MCRWLVVRPYYQLDFKGQGLTEPGGESGPLETFGREFDYAEFSTITNPVALVDLSGLPNHTNTQTYALRRM